MISSPVYYKSSRDFVRASTLLLITFTTVFFPRLLDILGAPEIINFAHFGVVPFACLWVITKSQTRDRIQIKATWAIIFSLLILLTVILASALINQAGFVNVILEFLLLTESFILLIAVTSLTITIDRVRLLQNWLGIFALVNFLFVCFQYFVLRESNPDNLFGIFFSVAGATVSSIVSITFALYYLTCKKDIALWIRVLVIVAAIGQLLISDTKLVLGSLILGFLLLSFTKLNQRTLIYMLSGFLIVYGFSWAMYNLPYFTSYSYWIKPEYFSSDNEFTRAKGMGIAMIPSFYHTPLDWFFGLGPGHGVSRLGGWMMDKYWPMLQPLGGTHPYPMLVTDITKAAFHESRSVAGTAMFAPLFAWVGIWSDLGLLGLAAYLSVWGVIWKKLCLDDFSRLLVLSQVGIGFFPGYLEEPGSMLFITFILGLRWLELRQLSQA